MSHINNQRGNVLLISLVLTAFVGIGAATILSRNQAGQKVQQQTNLPAVFDQIKATLVGAVMSPQSWQITQERNAKIFAELSQDLSKNDSPPDGRNIDIYLEDSKLPYYAATNEGAGFTMKGTPCGQPGGQSGAKDESFNKDRGNDKCPIRYNVFLLSHVQHNGAWVDTLRFELLYRPQKAIMAINEGSERYTFNLVRNVNENNVAATCKSLNGTYNEKKGTCSVEISKELDCPSGQGYGGSNGCVAMKVDAKSCGSGKAVTGFDKKGNPVCATTM